MPYPELHGLRVIALLRCSSDKQTETSIPDQEKAVKRFTTDNGMMVVDWMRLDGVSASKIANVEEIIEALLKRKATANDFDAIVVFDLTRFTRTGQRHGNKLLWDLESEGVAVIDALNYQPRTTLTDAMDSFKLGVGQQQVKQLAAAVARGQQSSLEKRRRAHCPHAPFGIDKLVQDADEKPLYIIRRLAGNIMVKLDMEGRELERSRMLPNGKPSPRFFVKSTDQRIRLIPGPDEIRDVVIWMMREYFAEESKGLYAIAKALNDRGIPAPRGGMWCMSSVRTVLMNPIYLGLGYANKVSEAIYYRRAPDTPQEVKTGLIVAKKRKTHWRPAEEWVEVRYEELENYLPADLRERVRHGQQEFWSRLKRGERRPPRPQKHKHADSPFLLTGILRSRQGDHPMSGAIRDRRLGHRYYQVNRLTVPYAGSPFLKGIRADKVEEFVLARVDELLSNLHVIKDQVVEDTKRWQRTQGGDGRAALESRLSSVQTSINVVIKQAATLGEDVASANLADLAAERDEIKAALARTSAWEPLDDAELSDLVECVLARWSELGSSYRALGNAQLKVLLRLLIETAVVDLETREVEVVLRVPSWAHVAALECGLGSSESGSTGADATFGAFRRIVARTVIHAEKGGRKPSGRPRKGALRRTGAIQPDGKETPNG